MTQLGRALVDLHGSKSLPAFARDVYYIGRNYEVTGPKGRLSWRRRRRHRRRRIVQVVAGKVPSPAHWPHAYVAYISLLAPAYAPPITPGRQHGIMPAAAAHRSSRVQSLATSRVRGGNRPRAPPSSLPLNQLRSDAGRPLAAAAAALVGCAAAAPLCLHQPVAALPAA